MNSEIILRLGAINESLVAIDHSLVAIGFVIIIAAIIS